MSRVMPLKREDSPDLEPSFAATEKRIGFVPNSMLIMAHLPKLVDGFNNLAAVLYGPDALIAADIRELVGNVASRAAGCQYCVAHTASIARDADVEDAKLAAIWQFETSPLFDDRERAVMRFARAAAAVPNAVTDEDFTELRKYFSEPEIVELVGIIAFFGWLNRWNDTLATPLEEKPLGYAQEILTGTGWEAGKHTPGDKAASAAE